MTKTPHNRGRTLVIDGSEISLQQIVRVARGEAAVEIDTGAEFANHMEQSRAVLTRALERELPVYGVTTGFGKCCGKRMIS